MDKPWGNKHQNILVIEKFPAVGNRNHGISVRSFFTQPMGKEYVATFQK